MQYDMWRCAMKQTYEVAEKRLGLQVCYENSAFTPPSDEAYVKFDYVELPDQVLSLDRKCVSYIGMVQLSVIIPPGAGAGVARKHAKDLAKSAIDGMILKVKNQDDSTLPDFECYVYDHGVVHPVQKSNSGWLIPVRYYLRYDDKGV